MMMDTAAYPHSGDRTATGVEGLDDILLGGLQRERVYLVEGTPGTGKTTLALQFLLTGLGQGESTLYVTLSESESELQAVASSHGWSLGGMDVFEMVDDAGLDPSGEQTILHPSELELGETTRSVLDRVRQTRPSRVVFDGLSELRLLAQNPLRYRRQILALKQFFTQQKCTVLMLDDRMASVSDAQLHSVAHGVITLEQIAVEYGTERRRLRVVKMRGGRYRGGFHDFTIGTGGLTVYPRLIAAEHHMAFKDATVSSGVEEVDLMLGGGFVPGTNALLIGPSGSGKTTVAMCALVAGLRRGERGALFLFDECIATLRSQTRNLGMDIQPFIDSGHLAIRQIDPAELSPGEFASLVRNAVQAGAKTVVIDSLNAYLHAMPGERYLLLQMHELLTYLNQHGVVTLMITAQHGIGGNTAPSVDISYLSDTVLLLRYFEAGGLVRKALSVLKTRTAAHELSARELLLSAHGVAVSPPLLELRNLLSIAPYWSGVPGSLELANG